MGREWWWKKVFWAKVLKNWHWYFKVSLTFFPLTLRHFSSIPRINFNVAKELSEICSRWNLTLSHSNSFTWGSILDKHLKNIWWTFGNAYKFRDFFTEVVSKRDKNYQLSKVIKKILALFFHFILFIKRKIGI